MYTYIYIYMYMYTQTYVYGVTCGRQGNEHYYYYSINWAS